MEKLKFGYLPDILKAKYAEWNALEGVRDNLVLSNDVGRFVEKSKVESMMLRLGRETKGLESEWYFINTKRGSGQNERSA